MRCKEKFLDSQGAEPGSVKMSEDGDSEIRQKVEGLVVEIPLFTRVFIHPNGGWPWDF